MADWLVGDTVLAKVGTDHLWFDLDTQHHLTVVDTDDVTDHTGQDADVSALRRVKKQNYSPMKLANFLSTFQEKIRRKQKDFFFEKKHRI